MYQFIYNIHCWKGENNRHMGVSKRIIIYGETLEEAREQFTEQYRGTLLRDYDHFEWTGAREYEPTGEHTARGHAIFVPKYEYEFENLFRLVRMRRPHETTEMNFVIL